jgi:hypothetical protein
MKIDLSNIMNFLFTYWGEPNVNNACKTRLTLDLHLWRQYLFTHHSGYANLAFVPAAINPASACPAAIA